MKRLWWMLLPLLLAVMLFGGCGENTDTGEYALRISLEEEYVPDEGRLSFLPWMSEYSRVLSVLEERGVPSEKIIETEADGVRRLEVADVRLSEFRYTMKKMNTVRTSSFERQNRIVAGHKVTIRYIAGIAI